MNAVSGNKVRYIVISALRTTALLCASGPLLQTFVETLGFNSQFNYIHTTLLQVVNVLTIILGANWADKGNIIKRTALLELPMALMYFVYVPFCFFKFGDGDAYLPFILLLSVGLVQMFCVGLHTVCDYKLPYFLFKVEEYGVVTAISGVVGSFVSLGVSSLISVLSSKIEFTTLMIFAFILSALFMVLSGVLQLFQKSIINMDEVQIKEDGKNAIPLSKVFAHPAFYRLIIPNLLRGFATGALSVLAIAAFDLGFDETVSSALVSVQSAAGLAGCVVFGILSVYINPRVIAFLGSLTFLFLPLMLSENKYVFLAVATVVVFGRTFVDYSVPVALMKVVPVEIAGPYNAWRMVLHSGGTLIATSIAAFIPIELLFGIAIVFQLIAGSMFMLDKIMRKDSPVFLRKKQMGGTSK